MEATVRTPAELTDGMDLFHGESNRSLAQLLEMVVEYDRRGGGGRMELPRWRRGCVSSSG